MTYWPWELARVEGRTLAEYGVRFIMHQPPHRPVAKVSVGERLRMLAVFSLPEDTGTLNLRKERLALTSLVREIAEENHTNIELQVLQYGATRQRLRRLLGEPGWDIVHLSGHGLATGLILEDDAGRPDLISATELADLLHLTRDRIKLITLSACESAAVTAAGYLDLLGLGAPRQARRDDAESTRDRATLPSMATALARDMDCAVLAMRYPVADDFAIALSDSFYRMLLGRGHTVASALTSSVLAAAAGSSGLATPALSIATPALFGSSAGDLRLSAPRVPAGRQEKPDRLEDPKDFFVGRTGPLTRASAALAPHSGRTGVLFYGMAGAGKTACARELAYTLRDSFQHIVWYEAPAEGRDTSTADVAFAQALDDKLPGLELAYHIDDVAALRKALPMLITALEQSRILIVLDNAESLLANDRSWRNERLSLLIAAITGHRGLSRLVLTSQHRPAQLPQTVLAEPVHALSLQESVLLAREWPHLRALMDATVPGLDPDQARRLARRTLKIVQGHPELIKLANGYAANPDRLARRLKHATEIWRSQAVRLDPFLRGEEPDIAGDHYLAVLHDWAHAAVAALPAEAATFFKFLCCLEEADRYSEVVDACWSSRWQELGRPGPPPGPKPMLDPLVDQALVSIDIDPATGEPARFRIHPAVAEAGRVDAGPEFADTVGTEVAGAWVGTWAHAIVGERQEALGGLVREAALHAAPYLLRQQRWDAIYFTTEQVLHRDHSPATAAALLPILTIAAQATRGTDLELGANRQHARALAILHPGQAETRFQQILDTALARSDFNSASAIIADLASLYRRTGRYQEADRLVEAKISYTQQAELGPWAELSDRTDRLHTLLEQENYQQVLDTVETLRATMASLPDPPEDNVSVHWNVRERILALGVAASSNLERWQYALDLSAEYQQSLQSRGAPAVDQARAAFNTYWALLRLGRPDDARRVLHQSRAVFKAHDDIDMLGSTLGALARVEEDQGRLDRALSLEADAIRFSYLARDPREIQIRHRYYADILLRQAADPVQIWAHRIAAAVISYQTGGLGTTAIEGLSALLYESGPPGSATSFTEVCAITDQVAGVHLADLITRLPARAPDGQTAMDEVLRQASHQLDERIQQHLEEWEPVVNYLA
ncbi:MAG TPA: CHAT domain-containing protein, partial [Streptosporangiaceae bacterium]